MNQNFQTEIFINLDFDEIVIDIIREMKTSASTNYDQGVDNIEIVSTAENFPKRVFQLDQFLETLEKAKALVIR